MATDELLSFTASSAIVADTSVLINFLKIDRMDLLGRFPGRIVVVDHVRVEITNAYPLQLARFEDALTQKLVEVKRVTDPEELELFLRLGINNRLGAGERAAVAVALQRGHILAIDDRKALNRALREAGASSTQLRVLRTQDIVVSLIRNNTLSIEEADTLLAEWANYHRFKLNFASFKDVLGDSD